MFVPKRSSLRYRIDRGDFLGVIWLSLGSVAVAEIAGRARPDAIVLDLQHGLWDRWSLEAATGVVPPEIPVLARVAENSAFAIGQALDAGAEGVIVPLIESRKQAAAAVKAARYPPTWRALRRRCPPARRLRRLPRRMRARHHRGRDDRDHEGSREREEDRRD